MANITKVYLLSVPLENDYKDTLYFANATAQHNYFAGQVVKSYTDFSYQRKDSVIRVPAIVDSIRNCNYVMYQNSAYSNKWFYAFINRMVYVDDNRTDIYISTDVMQTWMFEMDIKDSYIEREHVNDDTVGKHTIPEGLETGDFVCNDVVEFRFANTVNRPTSANQATMIACILVTSLVIKYHSNPSDGPEIYFDGPAENMQNGLPLGLNLIGVPVCTDCLAGIYTLKGMYDSNGRGDCINNMFLLPLQSMDGWIPYTGHGTGIDGVSSQFFYPVDNLGATNVGNIDANGQLDFSIPINTTLDGYTPKNGKCKVAPYNYFTITNNNGADIAYSYENFTSTPTFRVYGSFEQGGSFMCQPYNSKISSNTSNYADGWNEGIPSGGFPQIPWTSDYYLNWYAQNGKYLETTTVLSGINLGANLIGGLASGFAGSMASTTQAGNTLYSTMSADLAEARVRNLGGLDTTGGISTGSGALGAITNFASSVANSMQQRKVARMTPEQAKGTASTGTLAYAKNALGRYTARKMSCKYEYIKAIDDYFSMFGYKVNRLGKPLKNHRQNWWFTKTVSVNIDGNIPNEDMEVIKSVYNNGVTFWKNPANIKDYSVSNNIV